MTFVKGTSGNSKGRPAKARALTTLLETAGSTTLEVDGQRLTGKRLVARLVWDLATTGKVVLPNGVELLLTDAADWLQVVKWIHAQIDGPPKTEMDLTSNGAALMPPRSSGLEHLTNEELAMLEALISKTVQPT